MLGPAGPALPPRISTRFRELSPSPHFDRAPSPLHRNGSETPPPKPPRRMSPSNGQPEAPSEPSHHRGNHTHAPIVPYSVTTLTPVDSSGNTAHQLTNEIRRSESPVAMATIPPPAILQRGSEVPQSSSPGLYYSIPEDGGRSLTEDGQFLSSRLNGSGSMVESESNHEPEEKAEEMMGQGEREREREREGEREGEREEGEGEGEGEGEKEGEDVSAEEEEEVLGKVTEVVKAVMELSNRVSLSTPEQYVELVKVMPHERLVATRFTCTVMYITCAGCWYGNEGAIAQGGWCQAAAASPDTPRGETTSSGTTAYCNPPLLYPSLCHRWTWHRRCLAQTSIT